ncbi:structural maintenance of chromosomes protein 2 [Trichomonascus vanleenenianus]|uniref:condensin subunit SMC2 n=1 Tax=Trichomonascus vanleenenianus TaxID=2268995 RepID=UPI003EC9C507
MSTVRAQNLQDLIYKRGQAGVTKASVTIVFDNSDRSKSPIGFEDQPQISITRQVVLGGTSKFLINGHRAQQQAVQHLFQSVQLNINNPNFLIMQGRITKVLNMKSTEILALIEEAAGTRMFEDRREKAIKTMAKKEKKVEEILELLNEEIEPKLENLRNEKRTFLEFQQTQSGLERLEKVVVAHDYLKYTERGREISGSYDQQRELLESKERAIEKAKSEIQYLEEEIKTLKQRKEAQIQKGGRFQALERKVKDTSQEVARINTLIEIKQSNIAEESSSVQELERAIAELQAKVDSGMEHYESIKKQYEEANQSLSSMNDKYTKTEELLRSLQTGISSKGTEGGYATQLNEARAKVTQAQTSCEQAKVRIKHLEKLIKEDQGKTAKAEASRSSTLQKLEQMEVEHESLKSKMEQAGWVPGKLDALKKKESQLIDEVREINSELESMKRRISNIEFNYSKPTPNFNPSSVKGLVAQLFTLDKKNYKGATALEVCAGGRLFHVVVDTDATAAQLLQKGQLRRRVTIIPLNQIKSFKVSAEKLGAAQTIAPNKVDLALNLIGYDSEVTAAMEYVFGSTLICEDAETAKKVTFDPKVRVKTVTLDGDVYDPMGTLSGGSKANNDGGLLVTMQKYNEVNNKLKLKQVELSETRQALRAENDLMEKCQSLKKQMDLKAHEIKLAREQIEQGSNASVLNQLRERTEEVESLQHKITSDEKAAEEAYLEVSRIEKEMSEFKNNKGSKLEQLKTTITNLDAEIKRQNELVKERFAYYQEAQVENGQISDDLESCKEQLAEKKKTIGELEAGLKELSIQYEVAKTAETAAEKELEAEKDTLVGIDGELNEYNATLNAKTKFVTENGLECQKLKHEVEKLQKDRDGFKSGLQNLVEQYEWIPDQEQFFGQPNTPYNFHNVNINECRGQLKRLTERLKGMKNTVNSKVMNMIENVEKKEASLKTMIQTIEKDKRKIEETIHSLDEYKRKALVETWEIVTDEFGKIFGDLLPGGFCKLVPPENKDVTQGLEVKVSLGGVWKDSLAELSGGQRSLIALSLILALMKFKPAPMYILDEVDAALDLHHTQNVGLMIKNRFSSSQFIVVSLKDGLFNSANRIFRARFQDGTSTVSVM